MPRNQLNWHIFFKDISLFKYWYGDSGSYTTDRLFCYYMYLTGSTSGMTGKQGNDVSKRSCVDSYVIFPNLLTFWSKYWTVLSQGKRKTSRRKTLEQSWKWIQVPSFNMKSGWSWLQEPICFPTCEPAQRNSKLQMKKLRNISLYTDGWRGLLSGLDVTRMTLSVRSKCPLQHREEETQVQSEGCQRQIWPV